MTMNGTFLPSRNTNASVTRLTAAYELSDDLNYHQVECLEKKYGGRLRATTAATKIQRAFRNYQLQKQFKSALNRDSSSYNGLKLTEDTRGGSLQPYLKYQPASSLRAQLAVRSGQTNVISPRKGSTPYMEPKISARSFNEAIVSPRLSQRHGVFNVPAINSTPNRVGGTSPVIWVQNNRQMATPINSNNQVSKNSIPYYGSDSTSSPSLTPSDSTSMSPMNCPHDSTPPHPHMHCQNSTSSNSLESQNLVQIDSTMLMNDVRSTSDSHQQNSTTSSSSSTEINGHPASTSQKPCIFPYCHSHQLMSLSKNDTAEQKRRRMYRVALNVFNRKPDRGIQLLIDWRFVNDHPAAIAKFMLTRRGLGKKMIGEFLSTLRSELHSAILRAVLSEIEMRGQEIDEALRAMIHYFQLPTEAQKIDYTMQTFAQRYHECNEFRLPEDVTTDAVYILSFAIIMLNTDLHSPSIKATQRMTASQFVKNTWNAFDTHVFSEEVLVGIYERIKRQEIRPGNDHVTQVSKVEQTIISGGSDKPRLTEQHRRLICYCRVNEIASPNKKQTPSAHQREIFLFNDLVLITKAARRKDTAQYVLRHWSLLLGLSIEEFDGGELFPYAMKITFPSKEGFFLLNAKNAADRVRFIVDVKESVAECIENERVRIGFELNRMPDIRRKTARASSSSSNDSDPKHSKSAGTLAIGRNSS